jgi:ribosomal protein S16
MEEQNGQQERPAYQVRVIEEKTELDAKIEKLDSFLANPKGLDYKAESLLRAQFSAMTLYSWILKERILSFG